MTDQSKAKSGATASGKQTTSALYDGFQTTDLGTAFWNGDLTLPDVDTLAPDALAALLSSVEDAWEADVAKGDGNADAEDVFGFAGDGEEGDAHYFDDSTDDTLKSGEPGNASASAALAAPPPATMIPTVFHGDDSDNVIHGTDGWDIIHLYDGDDDAYGQDGDDAIYGGAGADVLVGNRGADELAGGKDDDYLYGGSGGDRLFGDAGNDHLYGDAGENILEGGGGHDNLFGGAEADIYDGGGGSDTVSFAHADAAVTVLLWQEGPQDTGHGMDTFIDVEHLIGTDYNDQLSGGSASNLIDGGDGSDTIDGGWGNDSLDGGDGDDLIAGGNGNDYLNGGVGTDTASYTGSAFGVSVNLSLNGVPQNTGQGIDTLLSIENVDGSSVNDLIYGHGGANVLHGNEGGDWLWGADGNDLLYGDEGNDVIIGGAGDDFLFGGDGADAFWYGDYVGSLGDDHIYYFEDGVDKIYFVDTHGISGFSDITLENLGETHVIVHFTGHPFGGSATLHNVDQSQIGADDFVFF